VLSNDQIRELFAEANAIVTNDHFVYTSGKHGSEYVNKDVIYPHTESVIRLCHELGERIMKAARPGQAVNTVVGPEKGAIILSTHLAHYLDVRYAPPGVKSVYAEKELQERTVDIDGQPQKVLIDTKRFMFGRGFEQYVTGKNVLIVEDILNTGGSAKRAIDAVRKIGGNVVGLGALCNRGGVTREQLGLDESAFFSSLMNVTMAMYEAADCPFCAAHVPINQKLGHGKKFLESKKS
jgi:orotate phosphoribosyltransferase